ncbi:protein phosphatase 2A structural subunit [Coemansia sp. RSA 2523]|nr:protein phosphatase 2A structural subunit [Coemansia sp. RSA 1591]KAJ1764108.1 protein phosphatase 2A structural subunit [Coemansia sp. RSA 1752]KAJ1777128.1 protein phosphatase 2A structural subunit [Coemansia sp. RSA 1824]KAJ1790809.1 protein phosphatase 2A structural subunit [Coemansia sp. RSA 1938]KAJ1791362.1 protein phosphatase 2A structural subunit [Coemansia sp. RSA 2167]KAJ1807384.1 protein phosphatase 2A structural subunit [Coemansia sp. RSA 2523]KAJ2143618.1 protein phosphatase 
MAEQMSIDSAPPAGGGPSPGPRYDFEDAQSGDLGALAAIADAMKSDNLTDRLESLKRLSVLALAMGEERTREELIPFLDESIDDEDELLLALAELLGDFVQYVGGPKYAYVLLRPLENLAAAEETVVREKAVESINKLVSGMDQLHVEEYLIPCIARLSSGEWFTSRSSAAGLYASAYGKVTDAIQSKLRAGYEALCKDDMPMIRRAAASNLKDVVEKISDDHVVSFAIPNFRQLAEDDQDSVRLLTVEPLVAITKRLTTEECKQHLGAIVQSLCVDKSWRVRYMVADHFVSLATNIKDADLQEELLNVAISLMHDSEAEVRGAVCTQLDGLAGLGNSEAIVGRLQAPLQELVDDPSQHVRATLAKHIGSLCRVFGKEGTIEHLLPLLLRLLKDSFPDVRLNIISKLDAVDSVVGIDSLSQSLLPAIVELAEDKQWRVRLAIIEYVPLIASQLGVQFFDEQLSSLCMSWLGDPVYSIREAATVNLKKLTEVFGVDWARATIIPKILIMATHPNYLYRMTTIFAITMIAPSVTPDIVRDMILPSLEGLVNDPIPNIRFNVAKSLEPLTEVLRKSADTAQLEESIIRPTLARLEEDPDPDVRFFAHRSVTAIGAMSA